ncbi:MAG: thymidylate synthase (FAD), partial [Flavobacteriia bacterium]|nr:thymidylate synthase (FAD) [Flavobacteriia bacterium]
MNRGTERKHRATIKGGRTFERRKLFTLYAKECARKVLPLQTPTRLYMSGTIRSWIHYVQIRSGVETQKEHRDIALGVKDIFKTH